MATAQVLYSITTLVIALLSGLLFFYVISTLPRDDKKRQVEEMVSLIINFILFIWLGKILIHFSVFIQDPMAILAYPSDSTAFYLATLFFSIHLIYKVKRHSFLVKPLLQSFIPVFLMTTFVYEFIQFILHDQPYGWAQLTLLVLLLIFYVAFSDRWPNKMFYIISLSWIIGQISLTFFLPFVALFQYLLAPWYLIVLLVVDLGSLIFYERKRVS